MAQPTQKRHVGVRPRRTSEERRVLASTLAGTTVEWYDFFIYAQAAGLVFGPLFFSPLGTDKPQLVALISLATIGISFLFRPLGAVVAGQYGDRIGRKKMLVFTLLMMGVSTATIGLLPTYGQIGAAAPVGLIVLRVAQGFSAGGEWGGAALMAVEHAPTGKRGIFGAYPQVAVPLGLLLATGVLWGARAALTPTQFLSWGWRIPFLLSVVLVVLGYLVRLAVEESPVFNELTRRRARSSAPLPDLLRNHHRPVLLTALIFVANNAVGYLQIAFFLTYGKHLGLPDSLVLLSIVLGSIGYGAFTLYAGALSDRIGRVRTFQIGYALLFIWMIPAFLLMERAQPLLFMLAVLLLVPGIGLSYGPMSALYAEMFPARVRYSGVSTGYALGAILGGAFAPTIAQALLQSTGTGVAIGIYIMVLCVVSFVAVSMVSEPKGVDLGK